MIPETPSLDQAPRPPDDSPRGSRGAQNLVPTPSRLPPNRTRRNPHHSASPSPPSISSIIGRSPDRPAAGQSQPLSAQLPVQITVTAPLVRPHPAGLPAEDLRRPGFRLGRRV